MTRIDLANAFVAENVPSNFYSFGGSGAGDTYVLAYEQGMWSVSYYSERGSRDMEGVYQSEDAACGKLLQLVDGRLWLEKKRHLSSDAVTRFKTLAEAPEQHVRTGIDSRTAKYFLALPVGNTYDQYEEFYEVDRGMAEDPQEHLPALLALIEQAKERRLDRFLIIPAIRGVLRGRALHL